VWLGMLRLQQLVSRRRLARVVATSQWSTHLGRIDFEGDWSLWLVELHTDRADDPHDHSAWFVDERPADEWKNQRSWPNFSLRVRSRVAAQIQEDAKELRYLRRWHARFRQSPGESLATLNRNVRGLTGATATISFDRSDYGGHLNMYLRPPADREPTRVKSQGFWKITDRDGTPLADAWNIDTTEFLNSPQSVQKIEFLSFGRAILTLSTLRVELFSELWPEPVWRWYQGGRTLWYCTTSARWLSARGYQISKLAFPSWNSYADVRVGIEAQAAQSLYAKTSAEMAITPATRAHRA
jgi:hypothetical protein